MRCSECPDLFSGPRDTTQGVSGSQVGWSQGGWVGAATSSGSGVPGSTQFSENGRESEALGGGCIYTRAEVEAAVFLSAKC